MVKVRRSFTAEFKRAAIPSVTVEKLSVAEAARQLGISDTLLRRWKADHQTNGDRAFPGNGNLPPEQEVLHKLRAQNKHLMAERDILKKVTACFARATT